ncbi:hypothetical protein LWI28_010631 [Acer negundo]|uniref:Uncharacterized protein n=1 Tax=Acer negundo TaxID=4023 RepID=A0AAD5ID72_ACENE|nr:hypothetical protein LWI28_010631 [Acer negundo]
MPNNHLEGPIPLEFCRLNNHEVLDLIGNSISGSLPSCFSPPSITQVHLSKNRLPHLTYLTLSNNNFEGEVPTQLCKLKQLRLADISHNNLYGHFHPCLDVTALHDSDHDIVSPSSISMPPVGTISMPTTEGPNSGPPIRKEDTVEFRIKYKAYSGPPMGKEETVEFRTKNNSYFYQGKVLTGKLELISRPIPPTFARLRQIESLDLSYNNLNGKIPPQLVELYTLSFFSVAHNNLSGNIPKSTQFCTYGDNGFEGNPFLYELPLSKSCDTTTSPSSPMPRASTDNGEDNDLMDIFYISFTVSYIIVLLGIAAVLYINPYRRRSWFYLLKHGCPPAIIMLPTTSLIDFVIEMFPSQSAPFTVVHTLELPQSIDSSTSLQAKVHQVPSTPATVILESPTAAVATPNNSTTIDITAGTPATVSSAPGSIPPPMSASSQ